jgi:membrane associated rhomboid family serine protease
MTGKIRTSLWEHCRVSSFPPDASQRALEEDQRAFCYGHPDTPTGLRCTRCDRPICGRCAIPASVGQHCPECVAEARRTTRKVRSVAVAKSPVTVTIIVICVAFFVGQQLYPPLTRRLASFQPAIAQGQWWRLLTPMLLHAPGFFLHIFFNMYVLWIYGPDVEQAYGKVRYLGMFLIAGFTGSAASYALGPCPTLGVGASGAIFGIVGGLLVFLYNRRRSSFVASYLRGIVGLVAVNLVLGFVFPGIDNFAHIGGLAGGMLLGLGFDRTTPGEGITPRQVATALAVIALGVALVAYKTANFTCGAFFG